MSPQGLFRRELAAIIHIFVEAAVTEIGKYVNENVTSKGMSSSKVRTDADHSSSEVEKENDKLRRFLLSILERLSRDAMEKIIRLMQEVSATLQLAIRDCQIKYIADILSLEGKPEDVICCPDSQTVPSNRGIPREVLDTFSGNMKTITLSNERTSERLSDENGSNTEEVLPKTLVNTTKMLDTLHTPVRNQQRQDADTPPPHRKSLRSRGHKTVRNSDSFEAEQAFRCSHCGKVFSKRSNLKAHQMVHSGEKPFKCKQCGKGFTARCSLNVHLLTVHKGERRFKCAYCSKIFGTQSHLKEHQVVFDGESMSSCTLCGVSFPAKCSLKLHWKTDHEGEKRFGCRQCGMVFHKVKELRAHQVIHTGKRPLSCATCSKSFTAHRSLKVHMLTVHRGEKPFRCDVCGKCFSQKSGLKSHHRVHTGEKPYTCEKCGKSFSMKSAFNTHQRVHTGEKAFSCEICGKCFSIGANLVRHQQIHTGVKAYSCDVCQKRFTQSGHLRAHRRLHTGEKGFICDTCGNSYNQLHTLKVHQRIHTGEKPYECPTCGKSFRSANYLRRHQEMHTADRKSVV